MSEIKIPSVLAFERKLDPSDALFYAGNWQELQEDNVTLSNLNREEFNLLRKLVKGNFPEIEVLNTQEGDYKLHKFFFTKEQALIIKKKLEQLNKEVAKNLSVKLIKNTYHWSPIRIREKAVRGTISNRPNVKAKTRGTDDEADPAKFDGNIDDANLQRVDIATLPNHYDTLKMRFTLRILSGTGSPSACNNMPYQKKLADTVEEYIKQKGFTELASRYAYNLANGRFLWRNRIGAEKIEICISHSPAQAEAQTWHFQALEWSLRNFTVPQAAKEQFAALVKVIEQGLSGAVPYVLLTVEAFVRIGEGQEVFPSQELILEEKKSKKKKGRKSKILYQLPENMADFIKPSWNADDPQAATGIAAMHSQKIGNALRTIDTWYQGAENLGPISIEPYGSVTSQGKAYRDPGEKPKKDFYTLFDNWVIKDKTLEVSDQHFVIANLIRGGVFGKKNEKKDKNKKNAEE